MNARTSLLPYGACLMLVAVIFVESSSCMKNEEPSAVGFNVTRALGRLSGNTGNSSLALSHDSIVMPIMLIATMSKTA